MSVIDEIVEIVEITHLLWHWDGTSRSYGDAADYRLPDGLWTPLPGPIHYYRREDRTMLDDPPPREEEREAARQAIADWLESAPIGTQVRHRGCRSAYELGMWWVKRPHGWVYVAYWSGGTAAYWVCSATSDVMSNDLLIVAPGYRLDRGTAYWGQ